MAAASGWQNIQGVVAKDGSNMIAGNASNVIYGNYYAPRSDADHCMLERLDPAVDAQFNSRSNEVRGHRECLVGTRAEVLHTISKWAEEQSSKPIFWLAGMVGTGKSTVAMTVARSLQNSHAVATFFFNKSISHLNSTERLLPTLSYQLAMNGSTAMQSHILKSIAANPGIAKLSIREQLNELILNPLRADQTLNQRKKRVLLVVDALDECTDTNNVQALLKLLGMAEDLPRLGLYIFTTSRPEWDVRAAFRSVPSILHLDFALHDVDRSTVDQDIARFFRHRLEQVRHDRGLSKDWPSKLLVSRATGLFIFASTVCRYVDGPSNLSSVERLNIVCDSKKCAFGSTQDLDEIYTEVMRSAFVGQYEDFELNESKQACGYIVGSIVLLCDNIPTSALGTLLYDDPKLGTQMVEDVLRPLYAVLLVDDDERRMIRIIHESFRDYVLDEKRHTNSILTVNPYATHFGLANHCLQVMRENLRENMCAFRTPGMSPTSCFHGMIDTAISSPLQYACRFWTTHLISSGYPLVEFDIMGFLRIYSLMYLEAMSILGNFAGAIRALIDLEACTDAHASPDLFASIYDLKRFALSFQHGISQAPLQVYYCAANFAPQDSLIRKVREQQSTLHVSTKVEKPWDWSSCLLTLEGHARRPSAVCFSSDGLAIASAEGPSCDMPEPAASVIKIWDSQTGVPRGTISGPDRQVSRLAFSPDGDTLAVAAVGGSLQIWDVATGGCLHELQAAQGSLRVEKIQFSDDGSILVASFDVGAIRLWNVQNGISTNVFGDLTSKPLKKSRRSRNLFGTRFDLAGQILAFAIREDPLQIRNVASGLHLHSIADGTWPFALSSDGSLLIAGDKAGALIFRNIAGGQCQIQWTDRQMLVPVALCFAPDGKRIAAILKDDTIRLWDVHSGEARQQIRVGGEWTAALSDGICFLTNTIVFLPLLWHYPGSGQVVDTTNGTRSSISMEGYEAYRGPASAINGTLSVSSSSNLTSGSLRVWDLRPNPVLSRREASPGFAATRDLDLGSYDEREDYPAASRFEPWHLPVNSNYCTSFYASEPSFHDYSARRVDQRRRRAYSLDPRSISAPPFEG